MNVLRRRCQSVSMISTNTKARVAYKAKRLATCFNLKDRVQKKHEHEFVYEVTCLDCSVKYIGETARRLEDCKIRRLKDHCGRDRNLHVLRHTLNSQNKKSQWKTCKLLTKITLITTNVKVSEAIYIETKHHKEGKVQTTWQS